MFNERNTRDPLMRALVAVMDTHADTTPSYRTGLWRLPFDFAADKLMPLFTPLEQHSVPHVQVCDTVDRVIDNVMSVSYMALLRGEARDRAIAGVRAAVATHHGDAATPISFRYHSTVYGCRKLEPAPPYHAPVSDLPDLETPPNWRLRPVFASRSTASSPPSALPEPTRQRRPEFPHHMLGRVAATLLGIGALCLAVFLFLYTYGLRT